MADFPSAVTSLRCDYIGDTVTDPGTSSVGTSGVPCVASDFEPTQSHPAPILLPPTPLTSFNLQRAMCIVHRASCISHHRSTGAPSLWYQLTFSLGRPNLATRNQYGPESLEVRWLMAASTSQLRTDLLTYSRTYVFAYLRTYVLTCLGAMA